jgi:hypothetical protein
VLIRKRATIPRIMPTMAATPSVHGPKRPHRRLTMARSQVAAGRAFAESEA